MERQEGEKNTAVYKIRIMILLMLFCTFTMIGCGNDERIATRKYQKILNEYEDFFLDTYLDEYDSYAAKVVIDEKGVPMLIASGYHTGKGFDTALYTYRKGKIERLLREKNQPDVSIQVYTDGIIGVFDYEQDGYGGIRCRKLTLYKMQKDELKKIGFMDLDKQRVVLQGKERYKLNFPCDSEQYEEFIGAVCKDWYSTEPDEWVLHQDITKCITLNVPLLKSIPISLAQESGLLEKKDFKKQIRMLKENKSLTQREFIQEDLLFYQNELEQDWTGIYPGNLSIYDITILNEIDVTDETRNEALEAMIYNHNWKWFDEVECLKSLDDEEIIEILQERNSELIWNISMYEKEKASERVMYRDDYMWKEGKCWSTGKIANPYVGADGLAHEETDFRFYMYQALKEKVEEQFEECYLKETPQDIFEAYAVEMGKDNELIREYRDAYLEREQEIVNGYIDYFQEKEIDEYEEAVKYALFQDGDTLCVLRDCDHYFYENMKYIYVYNPATGKMDWEMLDRPHWWTKYFSSQQVWLRTGGEEYSESDYYIYRCTNQKIDRIFDGYIYAYDENNHSYAIRCDGNNSDDQEMTLEEWNQIPAEIFGEPLIIEKIYMGVSYEGMSEFYKWGEEITNEYESFGLRTKYYDSIEEAYDELLGQRY